ncbi:phosphatidylinositide phosphatase SAC2 isoform X2 [Cimex lectularius]|uniref:Phosphatidylinositide phosphatase SAC2 n=1 Tax=Cimex lectularius TaxID=79782 RepID=A0A8I6RXI1_CIMLE|nr:phosphatidylinositide phosphatase SAC2 isoform X2 [Cimex lectularius]
MGDKKVLQEMEVFRTDDYYVLMNSESSLWCSRKTGELDVRPGWELANSGDPECLGIFFGLIGKIDFQADGEARLMLIKETDDVGVLPDGRKVIKIRSIAFLHPCGPDVSPSESGLKPCKKHKGGSTNLFEPQKASLTKTWGAMKSVTNSIKSTTQHAAAMATYQVKGGGKKDLKDREKFEKRILEELQRVFSDTDSFYFCCAQPGSSEADLTNSLQKNSQTDSSTDDRFFWNKHMLKDILEINNNLAKAWILPIIQGFVQIEQCAIELDPLTFSSSRIENITIGIISRRSRYRAGTRYKRRGLDDEGKCANYVETEQFVATSDHHISFVQVRGSVPLYWSQPGYKYRPPPRIDKGEAETKLAFEKHFEEELKQYGHVCIVNLVEQTGKEKVIWEGYTHQVMQYNSNAITYATFDFHEHCRGMRFENVSYLISKLEDVIQEMCFCWKDRQGVICWQQGVFRVNCIDCLDRTNVVQTAIGKSVLEIQLTKLGLLPPEGSLPSSLRTTFQLLWANNGDIISKQYAGTNALKGDYTRTGERKLTGMMKDGMNSANRYYLSRFKDVYRQATIDIMQGQLVSEDVLSGDDDTDAAATAEHVKLLIEDCKKLLITDSSLILGAWGLINADPITGDASETDMDTILILTREAYYVADYDDELDQVVKCQRIPLEDITMVELGPADMGMSHSPLQIFNKGKHKQNIQYCLRFRYKVEGGGGVVYHHTFRSSNLRFFNNVAIVIKTEDEMIESLRAICDCIRVAVEVSFDNNVQWHIGAPLNRITQKSENMLAPTPQMTRNISETQLENIKTAGSKAISNMTSKINKIGRTLNVKRKNSSARKEDIQVPEFTVGGNSSDEDDDVICADNSEKQQKDTFLPNVGIVMSNTAITKDDVDPDDVICEGLSDERSVPKTLNVTPCELKVRTFSHSSGEVDDKDHFKPEESSHSTSKLELNLGGITASQSENALRSIKSGFSTATNVLTSPSASAAAVLSPLTKLAKGMQTLGANLDIRRLKQVRPNNYQASAETNRLKEIWASSGCKSKLIAV